MTMIDEYITYQLEAEKNMGKIPSYFMKMAPSMKYMAWIMKRSA